jgi:anti-sigma-K factor RskA
MTSDSVEEKSSLDAQLALEHREFREHHDSVVFWLSTLLTTSLVANIVLLIALLTKSGS